MKVITICGSLKYQKEMMKIAEKLSCDGWCVLTPVWPVSCNKFDEKILTKLKQEHLKRIDIADAVFISNVDNYIGDSTSVELEYAKRKGKQIIFYTDL